MSVTVSSAEFIKRIRNSGLCRDARLDQYLELQAERPEERAEAIATEMVRSGWLTEFQAKQILGGQQPDLFIGDKYRILELLGRGGMGSVFLCEHVRMRRLVAVKVLPQEKECDCATLARFEREAQAVAALDHQNIVRAFDIDQDGGRHFLVMEFIDGTDLQTLVARHGPLEPRRAAYCIGQTALGLHHAWLSGWVHRDVKPGNLLLDRSGCIKILDMGLARIFDAKRSSVTSLFNESFILGTADYLAPEPAAGQTEADIRSDIYSLGATFYFLLTGKAPFEDGSVSQKLLWHRTIAPVSVTQLRPAVPEGMAAVLDRMLAKKLEHRFQTAGEVVEALLPWSSPPPPTPSSDEMPCWGQAVQAHIHSNQNVPEIDIPAPATMPIGLPSPSTILAHPSDFASTANPGQARRVPNWLAVSVAAPLFIGIGWGLHRESHPPLEAGMHPHALPIAPVEAGNHIDEFRCVEMTVLAVDEQKHLCLYASSEPELKDFIVLIDRDAIEKGRFEHTSAGKVAQQFRHKRIRVVGRIIRLPSDEPASCGLACIKVFDPQQIQILGDAMP